MKNWLNNCPDDGHASGGGAGDPRKAILHAKIMLAKQRLPLPKLMALLGDGGAAKRSARCPFHADNTPSFSVYTNPKGQWRFKCFAGCGEGDEVEYLVLKKSVGKGQAIGLLLKLAGL